MWDAIRNRVRTIKTASYQKLAEGNYERADGSWGHHSTKHMDHAGYQESLKTKTDDELRHIIKDADEASRANPDNLNNGYYQDEMHYALMELKLRGKSYRGS